MVRGGRFDVHGKGRDPEATGISIQFWAVAGIARFGINPRHPYRAQFFG